MNYTEIVNLALSYADREDDEVIGNMDNFLRVVESRINRELKVRQMAIASPITITDGVNLYDLPADFAGIRDIEKESDNQTFYYRTPEQMNNILGESSPDNFYTIVGNQLQIHKSFDGDLLLTYYQRLTPLDSTNTTNWLSDSAPDCYTFGLLVEISAFTKDKETAVLWDNRFKTTLDELDLDDAKSRWSGPPMQVRIA